MPERTVVIASSSGLHARPAKIFVQAAARQGTPVRIRVGDGRPVPANSMLAVLALGATHGTEVTLDAEGPGADEALDALAEVLARDLDADEDTSGSTSPPGAPAGTSPAPPAKRPGRTPPGKPAGTPPGVPAGAPAGTSVAETLTGLGVSPGRAAGRACRMAGPPALPPPVPVTDPAHELERALGALRATAAELAARAEKASGAEARAILEAQSFIADDPGLHASVETAVRSGADAAHAVDEACAHHRGELLAAGGHFAERAADLDDIRNRAVATVLGLPVPGVPDPGHPFVLLAEDLSPADTVNLDPASVLALVTSGGGPTSHTAILARARGLPAVVACRGAAAIPDGTWVSVDGLRGEVETGIGEEAAAGIQRLAEDARRRPSASRGPGRTADGHPVGLLLNIGSAADLGSPEAARASAAGRAGEVDAEGVGLFRTEFLFLDRREAPGHEEQVAAYAAVLRAAPGGHVVIRTLDAGTDKPLPFLGLAAETNPALGVRGLRVSRVRPGVLDAQLDAIAEAARTTGTEPWVMAPMVTTVGEAADFAGRARARGIARVGAMVEVPAAALRAGRLLEELDFLSVGTNDLSQYAFASDRQHGELADLLDPWQAALLRLVADCAAAGREAGKPVGVCGEAAADPLLATVLAGLGVTSLSMSASAVPAVRESLAAHSLARCREHARIALDADDPAQARRLIAGNR